MSSNGSSWEGTALAFFIIFTVLMGVSYTLGVTYRIAIPWLAILVVSAVVAVALRYRRRPRG
ncbi:MAG: hypothetical protein RLZZ387_3291 [Chloroflexota bacterium]|jgi:predicted RND superfamily exporter protein